MTLQARPPAPLDVRLFIDGGWRAGSDGRTLPIVDPATGQTAGPVALASTERREAGMVAVNCTFSSTIEAPFGGVKGSGYGTEGGTQAIRNFLNEKMITRFVG